MKLIHKITNEVIIDNIINTEILGDGTIITYMGKSLSRIGDDTQEVVEQRTFIDNSNMANATLLDDLGNPV